MAWLEEYELLFNLAYEWEGEILIKSPVTASFSKDNPYREAVDIAYRAIVGGEK